MSSLVRAASADVPSAYRWIAHGEGWLRDPPYPEYALGGFARNVLVVSDVRV